MPKLGRNRGVGEEEKGKRREERGERREDLSFEECFVFSFLLMYCL